MKARRWALAVAVSAAGLWFALRGVEWAGVREALAGVTRPWLFLAVPAAALAEYALRTERWRRLLGEPPASRRRLFGVVAGAFFTNNVLPFRAGEAARVYWTHRETGRPMAFCAAALVVDRLMDVGAIACLLLLVLARDPRISVSPAVAALFLAAAAAGLSALYFLARGRASVAGKTWRPAALWASFKAGAGALRSPAQAGAAALFTLTLWGLNVWLFRHTAGLFGIGLTWTEAAGVLALLALGVALPSTPGFIGTYEAAGVAALGILDVPSARSFPFLLALHAAQILSSALWGLPGGMRAIARRADLNPKGQPA